MRQAEVVLREGLLTLSLALDESQVGQLLDYLELIKKWTGVYNLTAVRDPVEMVTHHLLDSLAVIGPLQKRLQHFSGPVRLLDVGAGAGLPGVVIAIACPAIDVYCVDAVAKKAAFIQQVAASLKLSRLHSMHARVESLQGRYYEVISSRAFASLADFTMGSRALLAQQGFWMGMKGKYPVQELRDLPADVQVLEVASLDVPGLNAERCIVWMQMRSQANVNSGPQGHMT